MEVEIEPAEDEKEPIKLEAEPIKVEAKPEEKPAADVTSSEKPTPEDENPLNDSNEDFPLHLIEKPKEPVEPVTEDDTDNLTALVNNLLQDEPDKTPPKRILKAKSPRLAPPSSKELDSVDLESLISEPQVQRFESVPEASDNSLIEDIVSSITRPERPKSKKRWKKKKPKPKPVDFDPLEALSSEYTVVESNVDEEVVVSSVSNSKHNRPIVPKLDTL